MRANCYVLVAAAALTGGCASITTEEMQGIMISTKTAKGDAVDKAECTLKNTRGSWKVVTPASVMVRRDSEDMQIDCVKDGQSTGLAKLISRAHGGMFGNIILGGGIGAIVDHNTGKGYDYPNQANVVMGETIVVDRKDEQEAERRKEMETK
jgi:hypothetical protein